MPERTKAIVFKGDSDARVIELPDGGRITAERGKKCDDVPVSIANGLIEQGDWEAYTPPKRDSSPSSSASAGEKSSDQGSGASAATTE